MPQLKLKLSLIIFLISLTIQGFTTPTTNSHSSQQQSPSNDTYQVTFIDVGQGDSELIKTASNNYILIDANGTAPLQFLKSHSISALKAVILTHPHSDHYSGIDDILKANIKVDEFVYANTKSPNASYAKLLALVDKLHIPRKVKVAGNSETFDNLTLAYFNPPAGFIKSKSATNDSSLVIKVSNRSGMDVLFTGDAETTSWINNWSQYSKDLDVEFLKAAHHGSRTGINQEMINTFTPFATFISCGTGNSYHHPHGEALQIYRDAGAVYRSDKNGTVKLFVTGNVYEVECER